MICSPSIATLYPKYEIGSIKPSVSSASRFTSASAPVAENWCCMDQEDNGSLKSSLVYTNTAPFPKPVVCAIRAPTTIVSPETAADVPNELSKPVASPGRFASFAYPCCSLAVCTHAACGSPETSLAKTNAARTPVCVDVVTIVSPSTSTSFAK